MNKDKLIGYLSALGYALIIGFSFLFSKDAMKYGVINQLAYRSILAFIPLGIAAIFMRNKLNYNKSKLGKLMGLGIFLSTIVFWDSNIWTVYYIQLGSRLGSGNGTGNYIDFSIGIT